MAIIQEEYKLLRVNLTKKTFESTDIPIEEIKETIGGKGLGSKYLLKELKPNTDPLGPDNKLLFVAGPLTATIFPTGNRYGILYKSPLTGTYAESYSGGGTAQKMRAAGYFMIIIEGKAAKPTLLSISSESIEFQDGSSLWGKSSFETYDTLIDKSRRDLDILCIGQAGENLVKFANVQNNKYHSAGRCGPGAVMGSKNLKAIIFSGKLKPSLNAQPKFQKLVQKMLKKMRGMPDAFGKEGFYRQFGTPIIVDWANELGCFPTKYFSEGYSDYSENINAHALNDQILKKRVGCWNCFFTCGKYVEVEEGPYKCSVEGPEYETIAVFGGICDIRDIGAIAMLNEYCDSVGVDTITAGNICGLAIESKLRKRIPGIENVEISYNNPLQVLAFLKELVAKKGIASEFAEGTRFISEKYKLDDFAMHVKGLDFAGYDPRAFRGFAISYGVAPEGPTHLRSVYHGIERKLPDRLSYDNKIEPMINEENRMAIIDSLIVCKFIRGVLDWETMVEIYNTIFESDISIADLQQIANNMVDMSRRFNVQEGFGRNDDFMPDRVYKEKIHGKNGNINELDRDQYSKMLDEYYKLRGWSLDGVPEEKI
jgi:aldehyde:ferredoxin oxidoreductase